MAAVAGEGCFEVRGSGLLTATRARVGGFEAGIESLGSDQALRVCPRAETPRGGQTLEVGDAGMLAALPAQVSVVSSLTVWPVPPNVARGDSVTLSGTGFDTASPTNNLVIFGGDARATVTQAGSETLVVTVPDGALTGPLTVALESVDPPSTAVQAGTPIVVRSFGIADVQPAQVYAGETIVVSLDLPLEEAAVGALEVTVDGSLVEWDIQDDTTLQVTLPSSLEEGEVTLCVRGDLAEPCTQPGDLTVLGPGHTDLLRAPVCPTLVASGSEVAYAYPAELSGTPGLDHDLVFLLDDELDAVYMLTLDPTAGQTAILPLPDGGTYSQLVAHIGCQTFGDSACHAPGTTIPSLGYIAVARQRLNGKQSIVIVPLSDESNVMEVDLEADWAVERLVVVNAARLGVIVGKPDGSANSRVAVLDLRAGPATSLPAGIDLGGFLIDSAPIDRPVSKLGEPNWVTHVVSVRPVSPPSAATGWVHVDFGTQIADSVAVAGPVQGALPLAGGLQWIPGMDAVLVADDGVAHVVAFAGAAPAWSTVRAETEIVAEDPCVDPCAVDAEPTTTVFGADDFRWQLRPLGHPLDPHAGTGHRGRFRTAHLRRVLGRAAAGRSPCRSPDRPRQRHRQPGL